VFTNVSRLKQLRAVCAGAALITAPLALSTTPAIASTTSGSACPGQAFSQPFAAWGDSNYYTLAPGGDFASTSGWKFSGGAEVVKTTRPDGTTGTVLNLPSKAQATSAPMCVTLEYQTARVFVRDVKGSEGVAVSLSYAGTSTANNPKYTGTVNGKAGSWAPSEAFKTQPEIAGAKEGPREVRFVFVAGGSSSDFQLFDLYVDPRRT
jgi:hypothetical protein